LHSISCAAGYNLRWLKRAIVRLGISPAFLRLLQAALSQLRALPTHYKPAARIETEPPANLGNEQNRFKTLIPVNYFRLGFCL
jgi:IS5 family transposase